MKVKEHVYLYTVFSTYDHPHTELVSRRAVFGLYCIKILNLSYDDLGEPSRLLEKKLMHGYLYV